MSRIYCDYNATTPLDPRVAAALRPWWDGQFGNAGSLHALGRTARAAVDGARRQVAAALRVSTDEIVFTSGATEANNLAIRGAALASTARGRHLITSAIEHPSVLQVFARLEREGFRVTRVPVGASGVVAAEDVAAAITPETTLISLMAVNNEVGTIQPVAAVGDLARRRGIVLHVDAVQALGKLPVDIEAWRADLVTLSAHKAYGPQGIGALYRRRGVAVEPLCAGGHQEHDLRPGTEPVALIVGCGAAVELAAREQADDATRVLALRQELERALTALDGCTINGNATQRVSTTVNVHVDGVDARTLVTCLDLDGIAVSTGAACTSGRVEPSHVLLAMGRTPEAALSCVRISLGRYSSAADVQALAAAFQRHVPRLRAASTTLAGRR